MPPNDVSEPEEEDAGPSLPDASFSLNEATLADDERDFARTMGFGEDGSDGASTLADVDESAESAPAPDSVIADGDEDSAPEEAASSEVTEPPSDEAKTEASSDQAVAEDEADAVSRESAEVALDEIHSRSATAANSFQTDIEAGVAALAAVPIAPPAAEGAESVLDAVAADEIAALKAALSAALEEKKEDALESDVDALCLERDELLDQNGALCGELARSKARIEELTSSLKNARNVLTPLPEGERALRAEVLGLRARLKENAGEISGLQSDLDAAKTDLAIATARVDDREHELSVAVQTREELAAEIEEQSRVVDDLRNRDRDALALATRLQAENNELRSTQIALEETIEARDLEMAAREEHLSVLRQGLGARDLQILEAQDQVEAARQETAALEAESSRQGLSLRQLEDRITRRDSRIAALVQTLSDIENAIGHRRSAQSRTEDASSTADVDVTA